MKLPFLLFTLTAVFSWQNMQAQLGTPFAAGARGAAMGNASSTFTDINSSFSNQAGLGFLEEISFVASGETRFLNTGIYGVSFAAGIPVQKVGTLGISIQHLGNEAYNEQKIGIAYARQLFKRLSIGAQVDYLGARVAEYGAVHTGTFELGLLAKITDEFTLGFHTFSPIRIKLPTAQLQVMDKLPALFKLGAAYQPAKQVLLTAELEKNLDYPFNGKFGVEYRPLDLLALRAGVQTAPFSASFGLGVQWAGVQLDIASSYHQALGFTPHVSLLYALKKKK